MEKNEKSDNSNYCDFLEIETVQGKSHEICLNPQMHKINKVQDGKRLSCIGNHCGLAVCGKNKQEIG